MLPEMFVFQAHEIEYANKFIADLINAVPLSMNFWSRKSEHPVLSNNAVVDVFNVSDADEFNRLFLNFSPEYQPDGTPTAEKAKECVNKAFTDGYAHFEWMHLTKDKELLPAEVFLVRIEHRNEVYVIGFARDQRELSKTLSMLRDMEELAYTDDLTGLYNRRFFMKCAHDLLIETKRTRDRFYIVMLDADYFREVNNTFGHQAGDYVLQTIAGLAKGTMRSSDVVGRYGGEEYIIAMSCQETASALDIAERIRALVENHRFIYCGREIAVTISLGVAEASAHTLIVDEVIAHADAALYRAKKNGRNSVELYVK